jgi:hypothetical protein
MFIFVPLCRSFLILFRSRVLWTSPLKGGPLRGLTIRSSQVCHSFIWFRDTHSSVLEESLRKLGVEKLSKDDVQKMQWELLEAKNWELDSFHAYYCQTAYGGKHYNIGLSRW